MCKLFKLKINRENFIVHCKEYLNQYIENPIGVEVGVLEGDFSEYILNTWPNIKLYSIDLWTHQNSYTYSDPANRSQENFDMMYNRVINRFRKYEDKSIIIKEESTIASRKFHNESIDFIYLDANHRYENVLEDIKSWFPKVKRYGIISGHDFIEDGSRMVDGVPTYFGVQKAVKEFFQNQIVFYTDEAWSNWFVIKNL